MVEGEAFPILGETFQINYVENPGAAFGLTIADLFQWLGFEMTAETAKLILTLFSLMAVIVIVWLIRQVWNHRSALPFFLALILGGALGNIVDRVFYGVWFDAMNSYDGGLLHGRVVDMFYLNIYQGEFLGLSWNLLPVFNIADAAITLGILTVLIFQRRFGKQHLKRSLALEPPSVSPEPASPETLSPASEQKE